MKFIDRTRTGVWGSGYGGYVTGRLLEQDNGTFQCGIAVAPITSWAHYGKIYSFYEEKLINNWISKMKLFICDSVVQFTIFFGIIYFLTFSIRLVQGMYTFRGGNFCIAYVALATHQIFISVSRSVTYDKNLSCRFCFLSITAIIC